MKYNSSISLTFLPLLLFSLISEGCGLRDAKRQQKRNESDQETRHSAELSRELMEEEAALARRDLEKRIQYLRAIEGEYHGSYSAISPSGTSLHGANVYAIFALQNMPASFDDLRPIGPSNVQMEMDNLSFAVEIVEESISQPDNRTLCTQTGVKPDFELGLIRVTCTNIFNAPSREYLFALDHPEDGSMSSRTDPSMKARSSAASRALIDGSVHLISQMNLRITSPYGKVFRTVMRRHEWIYSSQSDLSDE